MTTMASPCDVKEIGVRKNQEMLKKNFLFGFGIPARFRLAMCRKAIRSATEVRHGKLSPSQGKYCTV